MPKATPLTPDALEPHKATPLAATKQRGEEHSDPIWPLQIRIPRSAVKAIKRAAVDNDQTVSAFMLACFHDYMEKRKHGKMET